MVKNTTVCFSLTFHTHSLSYDYSFEKVSNSSWPIKSVFRIINPSEILVALSAWPEKRDFDLSDLLAVNNITLLNAPKHGHIYVVEVDGFKIFYYDPIPEYIGKDSVTFMADVEGQRYKLVIEL